MTTSPRVSVLTINFNGGRYLANCVGSVLAQTYDDWEHVVVDCGSTDDSLSVLDSLRHDRLKVVRIGQCGLSVARNTAAARAAGDYLAVLDADDQALPKRLALQVAALDADPSLVAVGGTPIMRYATRNGAGGGRETDEMRRFPTDHEGLTALLSCCLNPIPHSNLTYRKSAFEAVGRYAEAQEKCEDFDLILRLAAVGRIGSIAEPVGVVRAARADSHTFRYQPGGRGVDFFACRAMFLAAAPLATRERLHAPIEAWLSAIGRRGRAALQARWVMHQFVGGPWRTTRQSLRLLLGAFVGSAPSLLVNAGHRWVWTPAQPRQILENHILPSIKTGGRA